MKNINDLATLIKENSVSKLEDKLRTLQTELFTSLKDLRSKVETKVGQQEYDKQRQLLE
jgi:hypothetical protein